MVDPYDWLDVAKAHRPPTHYQLLGISPRVQDAAEIRAAADRQLRRVQPHLTGPHGSLARILRAELAQARDTLMDPERRAIYDTLSPDAELQPAEAPAAKEPPTLEDDDAAPEEKAPPQVQAAAAPVEPWWQESPPAEAAAPAAWWQEAMPDEPGPPPAATSPAPAPIPTGRLEPSRPRTASPPAPPRKTRPDPLELEPATSIVRPTSRKRGTPLLPIVVGGLLVVALIAGGAYYGFVRKKTPTPTTESQDLTKGTDPQPRPPVEPTPKDDELPPDPPAAKDFVEKLRPKMFKGHQGGVSGIASARSGQRFVSVGFDQTVRVWSVTKDDVTTRYRLKSPGIGVAFYREDRGIAAADGLTVALLDATRMSAAKPLESPRAGVSGIAITEDGARLLTGMTDGTLRLWDTAGARFDEWPVAPRGPIAVAISPDGSKAAAAVAEGPVSVWDLRNRNRVHEWSPHRGGAVAVAFSPDGNRIATAGADSTGAVFDLVTKKEICRLNGHNGPLVGIAWLSDGRQVVTASIDETARLWSADTGQSRRWVQTLSGRASCLAADPSDRFVLVSTSAGPIHLIPLPRVRAETLTAAAAKGPGDPLAVPDLEAVEAAIAKVRTELAKDFAYERPDDVAILADNLRRRAAGENVPPPLRYGLLRESRALAIRAADPVTAVGAVEDMAAWFDVDELAEKATTVAAMPPDTDALALASLALVAAERAETDARPEVVERILKRVPAQPPGMPPDEAARLAAVRTRTATLTAEREAVRQAMVTLKNAPDDQASNHTLGVFLCLTRQDWANGLGPLSKGTDPKMIEAARADLALPTDPKVQHRVGEFWYALAIAAKDQRHKRAMLGRARMWYEREAKSKLEVADAIKAKARLDDIAKIDVPAKDPTTLPLLSPVVVRRGYNTAGPDVVKTEWRLDGGTAVHAEGIHLPAGNAALYSRFGIASGGRLTLAFQPDGREIRINYAGQEFAFAGTGKTLRVLIDRDDNKVTVTAYPDMGDPLGRSADLPPPSRGPMPVTIRLTGTPSKPEGTLLTAAIARGPFSFPLPFAE